MKKIYSMIYVLMALCVMALPSCSDSMDDWKSGELASGQGVFFPEKTITAYEAKDASGSITLNVGRTIVGDANEVQVQATLPEGAEGLFEVPASVTFAEDKLETSLTISYNNLVRGTEYAISITFPGNETEYSKSTLDIVVVWPNEEVYEWEVISDKAVMIDNLFSMFNVKNCKSENIKVEKAKGHELYRFVSPFNNVYFKDYVTGEDGFFSDDFKFPYIVLDGTKFKVEEGKEPIFFIDKTALGFSISTDGNIENDESWDTFGSVFGNYSEDQSKYPLGSYDKKAKCFDFGATFHDIVNNGPYPLGKGSFKLYLDPAMMTPDYDRDYTWENVEDADGEYISELEGSSVVKSLQKAKEDETFYRIPELFAEGYPLYFNLDKEAGTVSIPKKLPIATGMEVLGGNKVYVKGVSGESSYDAEKGIVKLGLSFYLADKDGNETAELATSNDVFVWGKSGTELFEKATIDDFIGQWNVPSFDYEYGDNMVKAIIAKASEENKLSVKGLVGKEGYDDSFKLDFDTNTGLLSFSRQDVVNYREDATSSYITMINDDNEIAESGSNDKLIGGISIIDGNIKFINKEDNEGTWTSIVYMLDIDNEQYSYSPLFGLDWSLEKAASKASRLSRTSSGFNVKLYRHSNSASSRHGMKLDSKTLGLSHFNVIK